MPLNYRTAVKLIRRNGGKFLRHGGSHDTFVTAEGEEIQVPRHAKDMSPGVERILRKKLGLL